MAFRDRLRRLLSGQVWGNTEKRLYLNGRDAFKYCEGDRCAIVQAELLTGPIDRVIYAGILEHWLPPHDNEAIPRDKREEIVRIVSSYLERRGVTFEVDWTR